MTLRHGQLPLPRRSEAGAAYMIVIAVLAALAILGLALIAVTQTELQVGGAERVSSRVFYAADAGVPVATARALVSGAYGPVIFTVQDSVAGSLIASKQQVSLTPFYPINEQPCDLCAINDSGEYGDRGFRKINHAVTVTATRQGVAAANPGGPPTAVARKQLTAMVEIQPMKRSLAAYQAALDPAQLEAIKF